MAATNRTGVIFDLGNTLVAYFQQSEWPGILSRSIDEVTRYLCDRDLLRIDRAELPQRVEAERREPWDHRVKPLEGRLARVFDLSSRDLTNGIEMEICRRFMRPTFAMGRRYDDVLPTLETLRNRGLRTAILSNTPWGSPACLWREEVARYGLERAVDVVAFCRDAGYRKPARQAFDHVTRLLGVPAGQCLFVGDDPRWDVAGPQAAGMEAILMDRTRSIGAGGEPPIHDLRELLDRL